MMTAGSFCAFAPHAVLLGIVVNMVNMYLMYWGDFKILDSGNSACNSLNVWALAVDAMYYDDLFTMTKP